MTSLRFVIIASLSSLAALAQSVDTNATFLQGNRAESTVALPTARLLARGEWEVAVGYRHDGDVLRTRLSTGDIRGGALTTQTSWVGQRDLAWLQTAISPLSRLEHSAALPVLLTQTTAAVTGVGTPTANEAALGDLRLGARFALLEPTAYDVRGFQWTLNGGVAVPTGNRTVAFSEGAARIDASTTATYQFGQGSAVSAHAGYALGQALRVGNQLLGSHFIGGGSFTHRLDAFRFSFDALTRVVTGEATGPGAPERATLELALGARYVSQYFFADLGVGVAPVDSGIAPRWFAQLAIGARGRAFGGGSSTVDADGDGIVGAADRCPGQAEDFDGFEDDDGCPDHDNDGDGIPDTRDACPNAAEDLDGVDDHDGCPETDADRDGVPDERDACPLAPEDYDGVDDADGCPEAAGVDARARHKAHVLEGMLVSFPVGSPVLDATALAATRDAARLLLETPHAVTLVGRADEQGPDARNEALSVERAEAVKTVLVEAGVAAERLTVRGVGKREPISHGDGFGRSLNRSVTFEWTKDAQPR